MQTGSVRTSPRLPLVQTGKAIAATVVMGLCITLVPILPPFIFPFLALPLALVVARWGVRPGVAVAAVTGLLLYVGVGLSVATLVFLLVAAMGTLIGESLRRDWDFGRTFGLVAAGALVASLLWGLFVWSVLGVHFASVKKAVYGSIDGVAGQYQAWGMSATTAASASHQLKSLFDIAPYLAPGVLVMAALLLAACSLGLAYWIFPRLRERISVSWPFSGRRELADRSHVRGHQSAARVADTVLCPGSGGGALVHHRSPCERRRKGASLHWRRPHAGLISVDRLDRAV